MGVRRTVAGFSAKNHCDRRKYEYVLPLFAFNPNACAKRSHEERKAAFEAAQAAAKEGAQVGAQASEAGAQGASANGAASADSFAQKVLAVRELDTAGGWCWSDEVKHRMEETLQEFKGTHNFHNYAARVRFEDKNAKRYMVSFEVSDPFEVDGVQLVRTTIIGQSFMLNQIRKMMGAALAAARGAAYPGYVREALRASRHVATPLAPEVGLFLHECIFKAYNDRWAGHVANKALTMDEFSDETEAFKRKFLYPHMVRDECNEGTVAAFVRSLNPGNFVCFAKPDERPKGWDKAPSRNEERRGGGGGGRGRH